MFKDRNGKKLSTEEVLNKGVRRVHAIVTELEVYIMHLSGHVPSHFFRRLIYRLGGITIGRKSTFHMGARFYGPRNITIGMDTLVGEDVVLDGRGGLSIGNHVDIASQVMIYTSQHDLMDPLFNAISAPVEIGDYVFIGPRAIILPGVKVGKGAVVGAGAVVTKDVKEFMIVGGVPAVPIKERNKNVNYSLGRPAWFR